MAHKVTTAIREMMSSSGKTEGEINAYLGKDDSFVADAMSGKSKVSPSTLASIARACGFSLVLTDGTDSFEIAPTIIPKEGAQIETDGVVHETEFSGMHIAITGEFFGLNEDAQRVIVGELGATFDVRCRKGTTDILVVGDLSKYDGKSRQLDDARKWGKRVIPADEFAEKVSDATGRVIG